MSFAHGFGITLKEVYINRFEDGLFSSELTFTDGEREIVLEARTSDAIAIAMRTKSPIYTTREILEEAGFVMENNPMRQDTDDGAANDTETVEPEEDMTPLTHPTNPKIENYAIEELEKMLADMISKEAYEEAAKISAIIKRKKSNE